MNKAVTKKLIKILLLSLFLFYTSLSAQKDTLKILHTSDIHTVYNLEKCNPIFYNLRKRLVGAADSLKNFFNTVPQKSNADMIVITGDLIDYFQADINQQKKAGQVELFAKVIEPVTIPLYLTLGNHDITSYWIDMKDSTKMQTQVYADKARAEFIRTIPCFKNGTYYKKEFKVGKTKYHLFFLDNGNSIPKDWISETELAWFKTKLDEIGNEPVIIFQHRYFSVGDINGDGIFFKKDSPVDWPQDDDCESGFLQVLNTHPNIKAIILGHGHSNVWEAIPFPAGHKIYQVETGTLYDKNNNWRLIKLTEDAIIIDKHGTENAEIIIKDVNGVK